MMSRSKFAVRFRDWAALASSVSMAARMPDRLLCAYLATLPNMVVMSLPAG
jgi:hypothetical protein